MRPGPRAIHVQGSAAFVFYVTENINISSLRLEEGRSIETFLDLFFFKRQNKTLCHLYDYTW